mgnify:CR=1 FL=1
MQIKEWSFVVIKLYFQYYDYKVMIRSMID